MDITRLAHFILARTLEDDDVNFEAIRGNRSAADEKAFTYRAQVELGTLEVGADRAFAHTVNTRYILENWCGDWKSADPDEADLAMVLAHPWRTHPEFDPAWKSSIGQFGPRSEA